MGVEIKIALNEGLYLKDPQDSVLGFEAFILKSFHKKLEVQRRLFTDILKISTWCSSIWFRDIGNGLPILLR